MQIFVHVTLLAMNDSIMFDKTYYSNCINLFQLELTVQNLPTPLTGEYECMFSGEGMTSRSTQARLVGTPNQTNNSIICETPERNLVPRIPTGKGTYPTINPHTLTSAGSMPGRRRRRRPGIEPALGVLLVFSPVTLAHC